MSTKPKTVWFDGGWRWRVLNPHTCQHCGKRFASRQALKQHTAAQHDDTNRHIEPGRIRQAIPTRGG